MKILLFSGNLHKKLEVERILQSHEVRLYTEFMDEIFIVENGCSFKTNAIKKLNAIIEKIDKKLLKEYAILSEDSGICAEALYDFPGVFSARFANLIKIFPNISDLKTLDSSALTNLQSSSDVENNLCLINMLKNLSPKAQFIACAAIYNKNRIQTAHGFLNGNIINEMRGENGFGYDCIFVPNGFKNTLGELDSSIKDSISHRFRALTLINLLLK